MGRRPKARERVLKAAREIVLDRGAGALTFDELVQASGVTRGGITYHFATKQKLLQALIAHDLANWRQLEVDHRPDNEPDELADLLAHIRAHTFPDTERRRFVTGMMGAATHDPSVLEPARAFEAERFADVQWDDAAIRQQLLRMAAIGMFWADFFECPSLPAEVKPKLTAMLETLAKEWTPQLAEGGKDDEKE
ncbi:MAG: TetR/AcrR family transcriptional regulator [Pseudomonadota bacterium]